MSPFHTYRKQQAAEKASVNAVRPYHTCKMHRLAFVNFCLGLLVGSVLLFNRVGTESADNTQAPNTGDDPNDVHWCCHDNGCPQFPPKQGQWCDMQGMPEVDVGCCKPKPPRPQGTLLLRHYSTSPGGMEAPRCPSPPAQHCCTDKKCQDARHGDKEWYCAELAGGKPGLCKKRRHE